MPDKLRQAQQVVATAVSKAAVLTSVSYRRSARRSASAHA